MQSCLCYCAVATTYCHAWAAAEYQNVIIIQCTCNLTKDIALDVSFLQIMNALANCFGPRLFLAWHATLHLRPSLVYLALGPWAWSELKTLHAMPRHVCTILVVCCSVCCSCETKPCNSDIRKAFRAQLVGGFVVSGFWFVT